MTNIISKFAAISAAVAVVMSVNCAFAQDDLDDLLADLEAETAKEEAKVGDKQSEATPTEAAKPIAEAEKPAEVEKPAEAEKPAEVAAPAETADKVEDKPAEQAEEAAAEEATEPAKEEPEEAKSAEEEPAEEEPAEEEPAKAEPAKAEPVKVEPVKKATVKVNPDQELLNNIMTTQRLRARAQNEQAKREIAKARQHMKDGEFLEAARRYEQAFKLLADRPANEKLRKECKQGEAEGYFRVAMEEQSFGHNDKAKEHMTKARDLRHPKAARMLERWAESAAEVKDKGVDISEIKHRKNDADFKAQRENIRKHLKRSVQYLSVNDMKRALEECEVVLVNDPYNQQAIRIKNLIERKRQVILKQERKAVRDGMIADVDKAWRGVYAVNAKELDAGVAETVRTQTGEDSERTQEQEIEDRMKAMRLPTISFKPPATIIDAVEFFRGASKDYDRPDIPVEKRGFNFVLKMPTGSIKQQQAAAEESDGFTADAEEGATNNTGLDPIPTITASDITFYEALKLVCDSVDYKFIVRGPIIMVMQKDMSTAELLSRKYDVLDAFLERMTSASSDIKEMKSAGFGGGNNNNNQNEGEENQERDWKAFFEQMGVKWPEGSSIMYIKTLGKLYVRNTRENLAEFEKVLQEMGSQPKLIEIETRFVEVAQEDLNSLGFEWILNSDYSLNLGNKLGKALGIKEGVFPGNAQTRGHWEQRTGSDGKTFDQWVDSDNVLVNGYPTQGAKWGSAANYNKLIKDPNDPYGMMDKTVPLASGKRNIGINAFGGTSEQQNGNRYLSSVGNHISGEGASHNDQFMRVNAFLGSADLSMILHMLSQRNDTDLLSAPKVVTKSGENAVIKVVTEYIYPQDYDVQLQSSSSSSSGGNNGGGSQSAILAVVEPQNFTMREVGVILDVTPTYSEANGGMIDLELKPQVVDEPTWKNYGMQIPFTGNAANNNMTGIGDILTPLPGLLTSLGTSLSDEMKQAFTERIVDSATTSLENISQSGKDNMTWYDAPMEQPFFHVRSIDSKVSISPGATVVMGGLITEQRKAMDDKVPFLGDIPFIGRLFRSHAEWTNKRNLLIFVTGRLITPAGRELPTNSVEEQGEGEVKAAPVANAD